MSVRERFLRLLGDKSRWHAERPAEVPSFMRERARELGLAVFATPVQDYVLVYDWKTVQLGSGRPRFYLVPESELEDFLDTFEEALTTCTQEGWC